MVLAARVQAAAQAGCSATDLLWGFVGHVQWKNCSTRGLASMRGSRQVQRKDGERGTCGTHVLEEQGRAGYGCDEEDQKF